MKTYSLVIIVTSIAGAILEIYSNYAGIEINVMMLFGCILGCGIRLYGMSQQNKEDTP